jgi:hypothetical protein
MNHRISSAVFAAVFILTLILISGPAKSDQVTGASQKLAASSDIIFEGILAVKEDSGDIFVRSENGVNARQLKVNKKDTVITRNGKPATYHDLKRGDKVHIKHDSKHLVLELDATGP